MTLDLKQIRELANRHNIFVSEKASEWIIMRRVKFGKPVYLGRVDRNDFEMLEYKVRLFSEGKPEYKGRGK